MWAMSVDPRREALDLFRLAFDRPLNRGRLLVDFI
jgi:hypothetical protein